MVAMNKNHFGKVYNEILSQIERKKGLAFVVFDPPNQTPETAGRLARIAEAAGIAAFAVGGSVGAQGELLDHTIKQIKENSSLPTIIFPGNIATISKYADAIYFMSMLNSVDAYYLSGAQTSASFPVKSLGLEVLPTSYIIVEPGRAVGYIGRAKCVPRNQPYLAAATALAGQYMGSHMVILESGGGAESPAPPAMIKLTKETIDIPLIVAGGVRNDKFAYNCIKAGADIVHVGTAAEETGGDAKKAKPLFEKIANAVARAGKAKR